MPGSTHCEGILVAMDELIEVLTMKCQEMVTHPPGHNGQWEGYGPVTTYKTGPECAREIRLLWLDMRKQIEADMKG